LDKKASKINRFKHGWDAALGKLLQHCVLDTSTV